MSWEKIISKKFIGKGTFGKVYKVTNEKGATGALKVIDKQYHNFRIQFKSAFEITRKLNDINYVKVYEWLSDEEVSWVMEYVDSKPISSLKFTDPASLDVILKAIIQVCTGLMTLHSRNIIHRDLKPQNILLNSDNIVKITDFDFIKIEHTGKQVSQFVGTPVYASPEHFISSYDLDIRSDLYSLGVILYELTTGKLPIEGRDAKEIGDKHRLKPIILPTKINPLIPEGVEKIIVGLLEKNPKDRYQHAHAVAMDLFKEIKDKKGVKIKADIPYLLKPKFVNREISFKILSDLFNKLEKKQGKVVLILGESGVGKSKLIQHFYYYLQFQDVDFYYSVCKSVEHSFEPLLSIFEEILTLKTETEKLQHFGKFGWDLVKFGILTEKDWMKKIEKPVELSGKNAEIRLLSAMTNFIQKTAEKPIVICLDDLQWADEVILKWLIYAERNLKEFPVLIAGLHRTEQLIEDSVVLKIENLIRIRIKNLKDVDVSDMIKSMLGKKSSSKELNNFIQSIVSHSKGNPLFIREILYYLQEKGKITIENNKWSFPRELEIKNLPSDIHRIILERIHELSREALITLQTASIIGKKFSFEMLLNMTGKSEKELLDDLIDCREVSLIEESGNDYIFIHDKGREVLETEIKEKYLSFWKELHLKAGEFLEDKYSSNIDEVLDDLANHYYYAEHKEKTLKYNELAGDRAQKNFFNNRALTFFERLISNIKEQLTNINEKEPIYKQLMEKINDVLLKKGKILEHIGNWKESEEIYSEALNIAENINDKKRIAQSYVYLGRQIYSKGNYLKAIECYEKCLKISEEIGDEREISVAVENMGIVHKDQGNYSQAMECYEKELEICEKLGDERGISGAIGHMGSVYYYQGNYKKAMKCFQKQLKIKEELGDKRGISIAIGHMGAFYYSQGNYPKAMEYNEKFLKICEEIGDKRGISNAVGNMGGIYDEQGNYPKAMACYEKQLKICEELGDKRGISIAIGHMGSVYYLKCNYHKAMECFERCLKIFEELREKRKISATIGYMGSIYQHQGNYSKAMECFAKELKICEELGDERGISTAIGRIGSVYSDQGDYIKAIECFEKQLKIREELGDKRGISTTIGNMGIVYHTQGNYLKAMECYEKCLTIFEELGNKRGILEAIGKMGVIYSGQGDYKKAMECYERAIAISRDIDIKYLLCWYLHNKANLLYKLKNIDANFVNKEALKIALEINRKDAIFDSKILSAKIDFRTFDNYELKIKNCVQPLEEMLKDEKEEENIATLNYELAIMNHELERKEKAEKHKKRAIEFYKKLYKQTPKIEYKNRIEDLEKL